MGMSALARLLGDESLAGTLRHEALALRAKFNERFWNGAGGFVNLALDGAGRACAVRSSNMGHCLWGEILSNEQAAQVAAHLLSDSMFSGHGVRTLAASEVAYNPLSYHNGSVWPHDNSLVMEGLRNYGLTHELERMSLGLLGVLETSEDFRLPELFCGFRRRGDAPPVPYEVACKPQAWAAGSIFLMLKSMLGMSMDTDQNYLVFNSPILTGKVNSLEIRNLQGRDWEMDVSLRRSTVGTVVDVTRRSGNVRVLTVK
jgi:glycogen debranching enzyme